MFVFVFSRLVESIGQKRGRSFEKLQRPGDDAALLGADDLAEDAIRHLHKLAQCLGLPGESHGVGRLQAVGAVDAILEDRPIDIYNNGQMYRDFTYVADLVQAIRLLIDVPPARPETLEDIHPGDSLSPVAPFRVVNIGNADKVSLLDFIEAIEDQLGKKAIRNYLPMQMGDVLATWADASLLEHLTGFRPHTDYRDGIRSFVDWFREYYGKEKAPV